MCYLKPYDETLAFALLFHDLGKIQVKTTDLNGRDHFKHHAKVGSELSKELCRRFKLTNEQRKWIPFYVLHHDDKFTCDLDCIYKYRVTYHLDEEHLLNLLQIRYCDAMAHSELGQKSAKDVELFHAYYIQNRNRCMCIPTCVEWKGYHRSYKFKRKTDSRSFEYVFKIRFLSSGKE